MSRKKKLLFVIESLALAGSEKSLIALLSKLDHEKYEVDLQLFFFENELDKYIPDYVNVLPPFPYTLFSSQSKKRLVGSFFDRLERTYLIAKLKYSIGLRLKQRNHAEIAQLYWECTRDVFDVSEKEYDAAIAYAQGIPTFYVVDKINARKKLAWVNANMQFTKENKLFQQRYYELLDIIVPVTEGTHQHFKKILPKLKNRFEVIPDIVDHSTLVKMSNLYEPSFKKGEFNILTVSRLDDGMKGMDITLESCKLLKEKGLSFHWYVMGKGTYKDTMEQFIKENKLDSHLSLIGTRDNPYPYFKSADLYVQTSRHEGYGLTLVEARFLNTPVVTTRFDNVYGQMIHGKNGLVTDINAISVADAVEKISNDKELYASIKNYLKEEDKGSNYAVEKFDLLMDELLC